jgi:hypothetical protein
MERIREALSRTNIQAVIDLVPAIEVRIFPR